jgi:hypothetical protein
MIAQPVKMFALARLGNRTRPFVIHKLRRISYLAHRLFPFQEFYTQGAFLIGRRLFLENLTRELPNPQGTSFPMAGVCFELDSRKGLPKY